MSAPAVLFLIGCLAWAAGVSLALFVWWRRSRPAPRPAFHCGKCGAIREMSGSTICPTCNIGYSVIMWEGGSRR